MALTTTPPGELGAEAPAFRLPNANGPTLGLEDIDKARALVVVFMCNHCPYVIAVQDRINDLAREYLAQGVTLVGISSNDPVEYPEDSFEEMGKRARERGFVFPYLWDQTQEVARAYGAVCTPDFFVYASRGNAGSGPPWSLTYRGRLDDSWKDPSRVSTRDLALALDDILADRSEIVRARAQTPSMGCSIKWK